MSLSFICSGGEPWLYITSLYHLWYISHSSTAGYWSELSYHMGHPNHVWKWVNREISGSYSVRDSVGFSLCWQVFCNVFSCFVGRPFVAKYPDSIMAFVLIIVKAGTVSSKDILLLSLFYSGVSPREKQVSHSKVTMLSRTAQPDICFTM